MAFVSDTVGSYGGFQEVVLSKFRHAEHEIGTSLDSPNDSLVRKEYGFAPLSAATDALEQKSNGDRIEGNRRADLANNEEERCPATTEVVIRHTVSYGRHSR